MEQMPYQPHLDLAPHARTMEPAAAAPTSVTTDGHWRAGLPTLIGSLVTLRELRVGDAPALFSALSSEQVSRFISPPPATVEGFERFIGWAIRQREAGQYVCFAIVPHGSDTAIGLFQVRSLEPAFGTAEWGFAIALEFWGSGVFADGAQLTVNFAFETLGVHRLEARAALKNGRGNGALRKLGAVQEGVLRRSLLRHGEYHDQALWTILQEDWIQATPTRGTGRVH
jgi:RimJ/RimL family protein N-acetyltransferase